MSSEGDLKVPWRKLFHPIGSQTNDGLLKLLGFWALQLKHNFVKHYNSLYYNSIKCKGFLPSFDEIVYFIIIISSDMNNYVICLQC